VRWPLPVGVFIYHVRVSDDALQPHEQQRHHPEAPRCSDPGLNVEGASFVRPGAELKLRVVQQRKIANQRMFYVWYT